MNGYLAPHHGWDLLDGKRITLPGADAIIAHQGPWHGRCFCGWTIGPVANSSELVIPMRDHRQDGSRQVRSEAKRALVQPVTEPTGEPEQLALALA